MPQAGRKLPSSFVASRPILNNIQEMKNPLVGKKKTELSYIPTYPAKKKHPSTQVSTTLVQNVIDDAVFGSAEWNIPLAEIANVCD
jgi:hypothetical protein